MRDEYVGDIGDFGKYILLKELSAINYGIKVGINWYYNTRPEGSRGYLSNSDSEDYRKLDSQLFDRLKFIVAPCKQTVAEIEKTDVLPKVLLYYRKTIPYSASTSTAREAERMEWLKNSLDALSGANVVFLDPDNGLETPNAKISKPDAVKHAFIDEVKQYYIAGKSVIIYNHRDRKHLKDFAVKCLQLAREIGLQKKLIIVKFIKSPIRYYVFVSRAEHFDILDKLSYRLKSKYQYIFDLDNELYNLMKQ